MDINEELKTWINILHLRTGILNIGERDLKISLEFIYEIFSFRGSEMPSRASHMLGKHSSKHLLGG